MNNCASKNLWRQKLANYTEKKWSVFMRRLEELQAYHSCDGIKSSR
jgi:hypothetical protein